MDLFSAIGDAVERLEPGDVIRFGSQRYAVLSTTHRKGVFRLRVIDPDAHVSVLDPDDFDRAPSSVATVPLPEPYDPNSRVFQRQTAAHLRKATLRHRSERDGGSAGHGGPVPVGDVRPPVVDPRDLPVATCPDLDRHLSAATERDRLRVQIADIDRRLDERSSSLGRQFDRISTLLEKWRFVDGWKLTGRGEVLARVFHESDLLCAAVITDGILDDLDPPSLAAAVSMLTYEHRSKEPPPPPWYPTRELRDRARRIDVLAARLAKDEAKLSLPTSRQPDATFMGLAHAWAAGTPLDVVMADEDLSGGDFVRNIKTLLDLVRQVAEVAPEAATRRAARQCADALFHGIVAASSEVGVPPTASSPS